LRRTRVRAGNLQYAPRREVLDTAANRVPAYVERDRKLALTRQRIPDLKDSRRNKFGDLVADDIGERPLDDALPEGREFRQACRLV
jgi:hypothetical protein